MNKTTSRIENNVPQDEKSEQKINLNCRATFTKKKWREKKREQKSIDKSKRSTVRFFES